MYFLITTLCYGMIIWKEPHDDITTWMSFWLDTLVSNKPLWKPEIIQAALITLVSFQRFTSPPNLNSGRIIIIDAHTCHPDMNNQYQSDKCSLGLLTSHENSGNWLAVKQFVDKYSIFNIHEMNNMILFFWWTIMGWRCSRFQLLHCCFCYAAAFSVTDYC